MGWLNKKRVRVVRVCVWAYGLLTVDKAFSSCTYSNLNRRKLIAASLFLSNNSRSSFIDTGIIMIIIIIIIKFVERRTRSYMAGEAEYCIEYISGEVMC